MSSLVAWAVGLVLCVGGGFALALAPLGFTLKVLLGCFVVFFTDKFGGRWFGYFSLLVLLAGLWQDPNGQWALVLPLLLGSGLAALVLRHAEPGWFGVPLTFAAFVVPVLLVGILKQRIDQTFRLPPRYLELHMVSGLLAILLSNALEAFLVWRRGFVEVQAQPVVPDPPKA